jgi:hypothetical protein
MSSSFCFILWSLFTTYPLTKFKCMSKKRVHELSERLLCGGFGDGGAEEGAAPLTSYPSSNRAPLAPKVPPPVLPLSPPFHPQSLMSFCRSLQVGCSRFSRCCHLIVDLCSILRIEGGPGV